MGEVRLSVRIAMRLLSLLAQMTERGSRPQGSCRRGGGGLRISPLVPTPLHNTVIVTYLLFILQLAAERTIAGRYTAAARDSPSIQVELEGLLRLFEMRSTYKYSGSPTSGAFLLRREIPGRAPACARPPIMQRARPRVGVPAPELPGAQRRGRRLIGALPKRRT